MKQITPETKAHIAALYYGQSIMQTTIKNNPNDLSGIMRVEPLAFMEWDSQYFLNVASLSSITDEDAAQCGYSTCDDPNSGNYSMSPAGVLFDEIVESNRYDMLNIYDADYLRSKGYALPAFGYSVDELVEVGVFKIKEVNND